MYFYPPHRAQLIESMFPSVAAKLIRDAINDQKVRDRLGKPIQGWITPEQWTAMRARFDDPRYKDRSEKAKTARQKASKWCGGSIPMTEHFRRLVQKGEDANMETVFLATHRKGGKLIDERAEQAYSDIFFACKIILQRFFVDNYGTACTPSSSSSTNQHNEHEESIQENPEYPLSEEICSLDTQPAVNLSADESATRIIESGDAMGCQKFQTEEPHSEEQLFASGGSVPSSKPSERQSEPSKKVAFLPVKMPRCSDVDMNVSSKRVKLDPLCCSALKNDNPFLDLPLNSSTGNTLFEANLLQIDDK